MRGLVVAKIKQNPLPPIGTMVLSRYGRRMRVTQHYNELHMVGVVAERIDSGSVDTAIWPPEWCVGPGEQMPWEYYDFHGAIRQNRDNLRRRLVEVLMLMV